MTMALGDAVLAMRQVRRERPALAFLMETCGALQAQYGHEGLCWADALDGVMLETEAPAAMSDGALARVLAQLDAPQAAADDADILAFPEPLRGVALRAIQEKGWRRLAPSIGALDLDLGAGADAQVLRLQPGAGVPRHTHEGEEYTLVVRGAFHDGRRRFGMGEVCVASPDVTHRPIAEPGEVCYALAVVDAPLRFTGAFGVLQRAFGGLQ